MVKREYGSYLRVPGFDDVLVEVRTIRDNGMYMLVYIGLKDDLVDAGICTPQMLEPPKKKCERKVDADGESYCVERYFVSRNGEPVRRYRVWRIKTRVNALRLRGAQQAIRKYEEWLEDFNRGVEEEKARLIADGYVPPRHQEAQRTVSKIREGNVVYVDWGVR